MLTLRPNSVLLPKISHRGARFYGKKLLPAVLIFFTACSPKIYPPKGNYPTPPITFRSEKSIDKVWDNLVDVFAQKGFSIRIIDRSSGLIVSEKALLTFSVEDKNGRIINPEAFVVLPRIIPPGYDKPMLPLSVMGEWNVRVKPDGTGTLINVNLLNFSANYGTVSTEDGFYYKRTVSRYGHIDGRTTGVFEKILADAIK